MGSVAPLESAVQKLSKASPHFNWVGIYVLEGEHLVLGPYVGASTDHTRIPVGQGVCGTAIAQDQDQNVPDVRARQNYLSCSQDVRSELVVLIRDLSGKAVAQIDIDSHTPGAFGPAEESLVRQVAKELGDQWNA